MSRDMRMRTADISFGDAIETIPGAKLTVRTNIPVGWLGDLDISRPETIIDFLHRVIISWEGFDMELSRESIYGLTLDETMKLLTQVDFAIQRPVQDAPNG